jgi:hypothetical protein
MNGDFMNLCRVLIIAKCAKYTDKTLEKSEEVERGYPLIDYLDHMYETDGNFTGEYYDFERKRMKPYHLLYVNKQMFRNDMLLEYLITSDIEIRVVPFVSGG